MFYRKCDSRNIAFVYGWLIKIDKEIDINYELSNEISRALDLKKERKNTELRVEKI